MYRTKVGGPRTPSRTTDANLDCLLVEKALLSVVQKVGRARARLFFTTPLPQTHGSKSINALIISKKVSLWYIFSFFQRGHAIGCRADPKPREPVQRAPVRHQVHDQVQPNSEGQHHQQNKRNQGTPRAKGRSQREGKFLHNLLYGARLYPRVYH